MRPLMCFAFVVALASCTHKQAPPDPAAMRETAWPACINELMKERMDHCPSPTAHLGPGPGACTPATPVDAPARIDTAALRPDQAMLDATPSLAKAFAAPAEAQRRHFERAVKASPDPSVERAWALLGLADVHRGQAAHGEALTAAIAARKAALGTSGAVSLATRRMLIATYAAGGHPASAYENLRPLSSDGESDDVDTLRMMGELADELVATGKVKEAAMVLERARDEDPDRACAHAARLTRLSRASGEDAVTAKALSHLVDDVQKLGDGAPMRATCRREAAQLLLELGERWRVEATSTMAPATLGYASEAHKVLLALFDQKELDTHGACTDRRALAHRYANLLMLQKNWSECGTAYETALREDARGERGERAALAAVTCRQQAWLQDSLRLELTDDAERMQASLQHTEDWRMMLRSFHRYICVARDDAEHSEQVSKAAFARAEAFLDGGALWESAVAFRLLAFRPEQGEASRHAAKRYAEIMDDLAADDVCQIELQLDLERLDQMHCQSKSDSACSRIHEILDRIRRPIL